MIDVNVSELLGESLKKIQNKSDSIRFETESGKHFIMYHSQSCCESVSVEDVCGDLDDLIGSPILMAEEATSNKNPEDLEAKFKDQYQDSFTWTFYKFATIKGSVTIRWYGSSNGYYGESVDFCREK